jgi:hypothetical protein
MKEEFGVGNKDQGLVLTNNIKINEKNNSS